MKSVAITSFVALAAAAPVQLQQRDPQSLYDLGGFVGETAGSLLSLPANLVGGVVGGLADGVYDVADSVVSPFLPWNWRQVNGEASASNIQKRDPQFLYDLGGYVGDAAGNLLSVPADLFGGVVGGLADGAYDVADDVYDAADSVVSPLLPWNWRQVNGESAPAKVQKRTPQLASDLGNFVGETASSVLLLPGQLVGGVVGGLANGLVGPFLPWNWRQVQAQANAEQTVQESAPVAA